MLSKKSQNEHNKLARQTLDDESPFLRALTQLADTREIVASEDIYSRNGIKLVNSGTQLAGEFYDRLVAHKLLKPIEQSLALADAIDAARIVALAHNEARRIPSLAAIIEQPELLDRLPGLSHTQTS